MSICLHRWAVTLAICAPPTHTHTHTHTHTQQYQVPQDLQRRHKVPLDGGFLNHK